MNLLVRACTSKSVVYESVCMCKRQKMRRKEKKKNQKEKYPSTYFRCDCKSIKWSRAMLYDWWCVRAHISPGMMMNAKVRDSMLDCQTLVVLVLRKCIRAHIDFYSYVIYWNFASKPKIKRIIFYIHLCAEFIHLFIYLFSEEIERAWNVTGNAHILYLLAKLKSSFTARNIIDLLIHPQTYTHTYVIYLPQNKYKLTNK